MLRIVQRPEVEDQIWWMCQLSTKGPANAYLASIHLRPVAGSPTCSYNTSTTFVISESGKSMCLELPIACLRCCTAGTQFHTLARTPGQDTRLAQIAVKSAVLPALKACRIICMTDRGTLLSNASCRSKYSNDRLRTRQLSKVPNETSL